MLHKLALILCLAASHAASPVAATSLKITVAGEANGVIEIDLLEDVAPNHVARITTLAKAGKYNNIAFHRVMADFMAQTGDVQYGKIDKSLARAGYGGSDLPDLKQEFSTIKFERGIMGMARGPSEDSANSQFFLMLTDYPSLNNKYTVVGRITKGLEVLDKIKLGTGGNGAIIGAPDVLVTAEVIEDAK
jgi:peptidylprolyl isomerase